METYTIALRFKDRNINGYVQKFSDHFDVFFQDEETLKAYGGMISFTIDKKFRSARTTTADDANKFYSAVAAQLR